MTPLRNIALALTVAAAALGGSATAPPEAEAARGIDMGFVADQFGDDLLTNGDAKVRRKWWRRLDRTNSELVRVNLYWNQVAGTLPPVAPRNPADPTYDWSIPDAAVREADARGLKVAFTVVGAPRWAEGKNPPPEDQYRVGAWKPNAKMFGRFAEAAATRYSGRFNDLPRVKYWEAWNEPNLPRYLAPQWSGKKNKPRSPEIYRRLLNAFYAGVKSVRKRNKVVAAGTSPFGDKRGGKRMRPYYFWREVFCLKNRKKLKRKRNCVKGKRRAHVDIYAHNPINAVKGKGPKSKPPHPDDGVPSNFKKLHKIVKKADKRRTILPRKRNRPGWATETWYESRPPEKKAVGVKKQARFMQQALYVLWKQKADATFFLQIRDSAYDPSVHPLLGFQTGVYFRDGEAKPSLRAVRFPFVVDRKNKRKVLLWGKAPRSGKLKVTQKGKGKRKVAKFRVRKGKVFKEKVKLRKTKGKHRVRAKVKGKKSLRWKLK